MLRSLVRDSMGVSGRHLTGQPGGMYEDVSAVTKVSLGHHRESLRALTSRNRVGRRTQ